MWPIFSLALPFCTLLQTLTLQLSSTEFKHVHILQPQYFQRCDMKMKMSTKSHTQQKVLLEPQLHYIHIYMGTKL